LAGSIRHQNRSDLAGTGALRSESILHFPWQAGLTGSATQRPAKFPYAVSAVAALRRTKFEDFRWCNVTD
jgi:hypothetical protein